MRKNSKTQTLSELLNNSIFCEKNAKNRINTVMKQSTIFSFWNSIVGAKFANITKPYAIKYKKLYVSAKSPVIIQEINLYKKNILNKLSSYSRPLDIEINDIIFNYKNYCVSTPKNLTSVEDKPVWLKNEDINNVELEETIQDKIKNNINKINFLSNEQKDVLSAKVIQSKKAEILQEKNKGRQDN